MADQTSFLTIANLVRAEPEPIKGSRHIATFAPLAAVDELAPIVTELRKEFPNANHHAFAYRVRDQGVHERCSDDGEPSGTAGRPILRQLELKELWNVGLVVTRIFGGTKLGAGGLVRAYGGAAAAALEQAEILEIVPSHRVRVRVAYSDEPQVHRLLNELGLTPDEVRHDAAVHFDLTVRAPEIPGLVNELTERTRGRAVSDVSGDPV